MRKIIIVTVLLITITFHGNSNLFAQACGQGLFYFEIYTINDKKENNINYEVFPINKDSIKSIYHIGATLDQIKNNSYYGYFTIKRSY